MPDVLLGWDEHLDAAWQELGEPGAHGTPGRVSRIDRGWSTILRHATDAEPLRVRNIGADVAVGDWVVVDEAVERVAHVIGRRSAFVRRASHEGDRAEADVLAANIDVVFLVHALTAPPNQRRLEQELVLALIQGHNHRSCSRSQTLPMTSRQRLTNFELLQPVYRCTSRVESPQSVSSPSARLPKGGAHLRSSVRLELASRRS